MSQPRIVIAAAVLSLSPSFIEVCLAWVRENLQQLQLWNVVIQKSEEKLMPIPNIVPFHTSQFITLEFLTLRFCFNPTFI